MLCVKYRLHRLHILQCACYLQCVPCMLICKECSMRAVCSVCCTCCLRPSCMLIIYCIRLHRFAACYVQCVPRFFFVFLPGQKLCFWTGIIFTRVYVSVCLCVCVSVSLYIDYLKKFLTDLNETWQDDV